MGFNSESHKKKTSRKKNEADSISKAILDHQVTPHRMKHPTKKKHLAEAIPIRNISLYT